MAGPNNGSGNGVDLTNDAQTMVLDNLGLDADQLNQEAQDADVDEIANGQIPDDDLPLDGPDSDDDGDSGHVDEPPIRQQPATVREPDQDVSHNRREPESRTIHSRAEVRADSRGNLINAQGVVVARAGKEARLYMDAHKQRTRADGAEAAARTAGERFNELAGHARKLLTEVEGFRARDQQLNTFGLKPDEQLRAYQIFTELRDKPEIALQKLLTRATAGGIDISKLGLQGGVEAKALIDLVRTELGAAVQPLKDRTAADQRDREQREADARTQAAANVTVDNFLKTNPDAEQWLPVIHKILSDPRGRGLSLDQAWDKIQLNLLRNGHGLQRPQSNSRRMPSGRGAPRGGNPSGDGDIAPVSASYDDIIKDAMRNG